MNVRVNLKTILLREKRKIEFWGIFIISDLKKKEKKKYEVLLKEERERGFEI